MRVYLDKEETRVPIVFEADCIEYREETGMLVISNVYADIHIEIDDEVAEEAIEYAIEDEKNLDLRGKHGQVVIVYSDTYDLTDIDYDE